MCTNKRETNRERREMEEPRRDGGVGVQIKEQMGHFILGQFWPE